MTTLRGRKGQHILLVEVQRNSKVLPLLLLDGRLPDQLVLAAHDLEGVLWQLLDVLADDGAGLEVELVGGPVGGFVPDVLFAGRNQLVSIGKQHRELGSRKMRGGMEGLTRYSCVRFNGLFESCFTLK